MASRLTVPPTSSRGSSRSSSPGRTPKKASTQAERSLLESGSWTKCEAQIRLEECQLKWKGFDDAYSELSQWITQIESQLRDNDGLRADLDEKSDQLDRAREIDYDIVTRTYEIDKIQEFLETIEEDRLDKVGPNE